MKHHVFKRGTLLNHFWQNALNRYINIEEKIVNCLFSLLKLERGLEVGMIIIFCSEGNNIPGMLFDKVTNKKKKA